MSDDSLSESGSVQTVGGGVSEEARLFGTLKETMDSLAARERKALVLYETFEGTECFDEEDQKILESYIEGVREQHESLRTEYDVMRALYMSSVLTMQEQIAEREAALEEHMGPGALFDLDPALAGIFVQKQVDMQQMLDETRAILIKNLGERAEEALAKYEQLASRGINGCMGRAET